MSYLLTFIGLFLWFGWWSGQAGRSLHWFGDRLQNWQDHVPLGSKIPEIIIALTFAGIAFHGWEIYDNIASFEELKKWMVIGLSTTVGIIFFFISLAGKESATVFYLPGNWDKGWHTDTDKDGILEEEDMRNSTMRVVNDAIAKLLGVDLLSHWYAKIWAFTKGLLISIPILGLCAPFHPITRELAIRLGEKVEGHGDVNSWAEFVGDGLSYAAGCTIFIALFF